MSIQEIRESFKGFTTRPEYMLTALIFTTAFSSFYLGRLSVSPKMVAHTQGVSVSNSREQDPATTTVSTVISSVSDGGQFAGYVASKSGTKYHLPWCAGAKQIKESNKIFFKTKEEAEKAGYTPASNCKGI